MAFARILQANPTPPGMIAGPRHHGFIDALRGIAVIAVVIAHAPLCVHGLPDVLREFLHRGSAGVQLFYALSAYTLCASFRSRAGEPDRLVKYGLRRLFRIVPMFWVAIGVFIVVDMYATHWGQPHGVDHVGRLVLAALLLHGFDVHALNSVVPGGWSVAVETQFYVLLPAIFWFATSLRRTLALLALSVVIAVAYMPVADALLMLVHPESDRDMVHQFTYYSLPTQINSFMVGLLAYRLAGPDRAVLARLEARLPLRLIASTTVVLSMLPLRHSVPGHNGFAAMALALIYLLATKRVPLLDNRVTRFYGRISYSAYLLHFAVLFCLEASGEAWLGSMPLLQVAVLTLTTLAITTGLATVTWALVEEPGIALGRRIATAILAPRRDLQPAVADRRFATPDSPAARRGRTPAVAPSTALS